jgi:hypothetical protein
MRKNLLAIATALIAGAGIAQAQQPNGVQQPPGAGLTPDAKGGAAGLLNQYPPAPQSPGVLNGCGDGSNACVPACQDNKIHGWLAADFLLFFPQSQHMPASLVTTGGVSNVGGDMGYPLGLGLRLDTGMWFDQGECKGMQTLVNTVFRSQTNVNFGAGSTINTNAGASAFAITGPSTFTTNTQYGDTEANMMRLLSDNDNVKVYGLYGTKLAYLEEDMTFRYTLGGAPGIAAAPGGNFLDEFHARNGFIGGDAGLMVKSTFGNFTADFAAKCALGINYTATTVLGSNNASGAVAGTGGAAVGGNTQVFTNDANIGYRETGYFSVIPEFNANLAYQVTERIQVRIGYTFLAWVTVDRPGDQMVPTLAPAASIVGTHTAPPFPALTNTYYLHGLNFGAVWKY